MQLPVRTWLTNQVHYSLPEKNKVLEFPSLEEWKIFLSVILYFMATSSITNMDNLKITVRTIKFIRLPIATAVISE